MRVLVVIVGLWSATAAARNEPWSAGTAYTMPKDRIEVGLFQPLRWAVSSDLELQSHILLDVLMPNLALKVNWGELLWGDLASRHTLTYPTGLYSALASEGTGGIIPHETRIPHIVTLDNEALYTVFFSDSFILTGKVGLELGVQIGPGGIPTIDLPVVLPRMAAHKRNWLINVGVDLDGQLTGDFYYMLDLELFLLPYNRAVFHLEQSGMLVWQATVEFRVMLGYKFIYGEYPFGRAEWNVGDDWWPLPMLDLHWAFP